MFGVFQAYLLSVCLHMRELICHFFGLHLLWVFSLTEHWNFECFVSGFIIKDQKLCTIGYYLINDILQEIVSLKK